MRIQTKNVLSVAIVLTMASAVSAQRRTTPAGPAEVGVTVRLQIAGHSYQFEGKAVCQHAPVASIYNVRAEMWRVQQSEGQRSIALTLWHPKSTSGDMFSLSVNTGAKSYVVNTVRTGAESAAQGSGNVTLTKSGAGGMFTINATAANGAAITGTIQCSAFTDAVAEGG